MNKYAFSIVMCIMALTNSIQAADKFSINNFLITPGVSEKEFTISLDNDNVYAGFQFDLYLTKGLTINTCIASQRLPEAKALTCKKQEDGSYRILYADIFKQNIYDIHNISGTSGTIITITVSASNEAQLGNLTGYFKNVKLSKLNGEGPSYDEIPFPITVVAASKVTANYTRKYGEDNPIFDYTVEGGSLYGTPTISCSATATSPVGTYPIVIEQGSVINDVVEYLEGTLTIEKAPLSIMAGTYTKKQGDAMPEFTLTYKGFKNNEMEKVLTSQPVVTCNATEASAPGEYPVTVSDAEAQNYDISYTNGKLIVTDADAIIIKAKNYTRKYGESNPAFGYTIEGADLEGTPEIACEATETSPVGTYDIIVKRGTVSNYNVTYVAGKLTIEKAPLCIMAGTYTKKQGETMPEFTLTYKGFKNNETQEVLTKQPVVTCNATETSEPGEYPVTVSSAEAQNYDISYTNGKLIVADADAIIIKAKNYTRKYGESNFTFGYSIEGAALEGTPEIVCEATEISPVGTYDIIVKQGTVSNYNVTYVAGTLTIEKAPLSIMAGTYTKKQGDAMPEFTLTYKGFKNNEMEKVLTRQPDVTCDAIEVSAPGEYPVTVSGAEAQNYDISYTNGTLTVVNKKGDVNGDGSITAQDALLVLQYIAGKTTFSDNQTDAADVNSDNNITAQDASLILQYVEGKISF